MIRDLRTRRFGGYAAPLLFALTSAASSTYLGLGCTIKTNDGGSGGSPAPNGGTGGTLSTTPDAGSGGAATGDASLGADANPSDAIASGGDGAAIVPCGNVPAEGACQENAFVYCKAGALTKVDCTKMGGVCKVTPAGDGGVATASCDLARAEPCGTLTKLGSCEGDRMRYCDDTGTIATAKEVNCAAYGQTCSPTGAPKDNGARCVPHGPCPSNVTEDGICTQNQLSFCDSNQLYVFDCGLDECKTAGGFSDCFMKGGGEGCNGVPAEGVCDSSTGTPLLKRCLGNVVATEDCTALGLACQANPTGGGNACLPPSTCPAQGPTGYTCQGGRWTASSPKYNWTFATYIVGDNNLADAAWDDINQMEVAGSSDKVKVVTQFQFSTRYSSSPPEQYKTGVYRMEVAKDSDTENVSSLASAKPLGTSVDMSSPTTLTAFVKWVAENYPAQHLALIMWDHGAGYQGGFVSSSTHTSMTLKKVLDGIRDSGAHLDLLGFDACLMGQHEVAMAFHGVADVLAASEQVEPGAGYPYDTILTDLLGNPTMSAQDLGKVIVTRYAESFTGTRSDSVTMSAISLAQAENVNDHLAAFAQTLNADTSALRSTISSETLLRFTDRNSVDISTALTAFKAKTGDVGTAATSFQTWLDQSGAILASRATGDVAAAKGLAFFLPDPGSGEFSTSDFDDYRSDTSFLPLQPWQAALANMATTSSETPADAGASSTAASSFSVVLTWANTPDGTLTGSDLDLYVYEPDGSFGVPANGTVSENGLLSADSSDTRVARESYELKPDHQSGTYIVLVHAYNVPAGEKAYPRLEIVSDALGNAGARTIVRGKFVNSDIQEVPMDLLTPLTQPIDATNFPGVMNLQYSNIWYATTIEVK